MKIQNHPISFNGLIGFVSSKWKKLRGNDENPKDRNSQIKNRKDTKRREIDLTLPFNE